MTDIELRNENGQIVGYDSDGNKVPVRFEDGNFDSLDTETLQYALNNTGFSGRLSDRSLVSTSETALTVGTDTSTIQEALNQIPFILRHAFYINIPDGTYNEDLLVPPFIIADTAGEADQGAGGDEGASQIPWIRGNKTDPTNVEVNSITLTGCQGAISPLIEGMNVTGVTPYDDEDTGINIFGCQNVSFRHISFAGSTASRGFLPYSSTVTIRGACDFGNDDLRYGVETKHNANVNMDAYDGAVTGSVTDYVIWNNDGSVVTFKNVDATGGLKFIENREGHAYNGDTREYEPAVGARATSSVMDQTITSGSIQKVQFDQTSSVFGYDRRGDFDTTAYEFVVPEDGRYCVKAVVQWLSPSSTTNCKLKIFDGTNSLVADRVSGNSAPNPVTKVNTTAQLSSGTRLQVDVEHDEGSDLNINTGNDPLANFVVDRIS